jgi:hypothetical protein
MNAEKRDRILERVRKMLRLANDAGASEGERDNAMRMAHATLAKYNLDLTTAELTTNNERPDEPRIENVGTFGGWPWARSICHSIAELFFCSYVYSKGKSSWRVRHYFIGRTSNATTAALVAEFVVSAVHREAAKLARSCYGGNGFERSFGWGAASRIRERVKRLKADERQLVEPESNSTQPTTILDVTQQALVLASVYVSEEKANAAFIEARYPKLRVGRAGKLADHMGAFGAGHAYGDTVSLTPQLK